MNTVKVKLQLKLYVLYVRFKEKAVCKHTFVNWYKKFDFGDFGTEDHRRFDRPKVVDGDQFKKYINANPEAINRKMSAEFNCA